jgi:DUF971 family protein
MLKDVVEVRAVGDHRLRLSFEDGAERELYRDTELAR